MRFKCEGRHHLGYLMLIPEKMKCSEGLGWKKYRHQMSLKGMRESLGDFIRMIDRETIGSSTKATILGLSDGEDRPVPSNLVMMHIGLRI